MAKLLYIDNGYPIRYELAEEDTVTRALSPRTGLTLRVWLALTPFETDTPEPEPIHDDLDIAAVPEIGTYKGAAVYATEIDRDVLYEHLRELVGETIYEICDDGTRRRTTGRITVKRYRPATDA
jgi:hypothetical protein